MAVNVIGQRMNFMVILHGCWLVAILTRRRRGAIARLWPNYCLFLTLFLLYQYLLCLGIPPALCIGEGLGSTGASTLALCVAEGLPALPGTHGRRGSRSSCLPLSDPKICDPHSLGLCPMPLPCGAPCMQTSGSALGLVPDVATEGAVCLQLLEIWVWGQGTGAFLCRPLPALPVPAKARASPHLRAASVVAPSLGRGV